MKLTNAAVRAAMDEPTRVPRPLLSTRRVSDDGRAAVAGREDHVRLRGIDRWLGGVRAPVRRWDGERLTHA